MHRDGFRSGGPTFTRFVQGSETTLQSTYSDTSTQPTCDYGYGGWSSGANRGYENYSYGYGYGQENASTYGYSMAASHSWDMPGSDASANPSAVAGAGADPVLSRINQRLDVASHLETDMMPGGMYSSGGERYDSYEACDSRAILSGRDLYRPGYDYGELDPEVEAAYEGQYDAYREQFRMRGSDALGPRAQGWPRDARSGRPMASGYGRVWDDPMGARGQCLPGASRLPSLFSQNIIPEYGAFQGVRGGGAFPAGSRFGFGFGNGMKQMRRTWKTWTPADFRTKKKKRKQPGSPDEPDSKASRTDGSDNSDSDNDDGTEGEGVEGPEAMEKSLKAEGEDEEGREDGKEEGREDAEKGALTVQDENGQTKRLLQAAKKSQDKQKRRQRDRMVERAPALALASSSSASDSCSCWTFLSLAGAWPLGSPDKADPVAQIRTSGRGRDPPRGLGGAGLLRPLPGGCRLPSGRPGGRPPSSSDWSLLGRGRRGGRRAGLPPPAPPDTTPTHSEQRTGWASESPGPRRKMQHLLGPCLGTAFSSAPQAHRRRPGRPSLRSPWGRGHQFLPGLVERPSSNLAATPVWEGRAPPLPPRCRNCSLQTSCPCSSRPHCPPAGTALHRPVSEARTRAGSWVGRGGSAAPRGPRSLSPLLPPCGRIQFVCSLCKYRTFYEDEMTGHLDSKFHKEHFKYVGTKLPKQTADFLQEYVTNKTKKTEELRKTVEDLDGLIQQIYRDQDLTQEIAMEHFVKKVEAAHCAACDLFIPMQFGIIQKHLKTVDHNRNRRLMMEQSKKSSLMVARSILNNKLIGKKLERYLKGENPFTDGPEEDREQDEVEGGAQDEAAGEGAEEVPAPPPVPPEPAPEAAPPPPPEEEEEAVPLLGGALQRRVRGIPGLDVEADDDDDEEGGGGAP